MRVLNRRDRRMKALRRLLFAGRSEECASQPVGFCLTGGIDSGPDGLRFFWRQSNRKDINRDTFLGQPRTPRFLFHTKFRFRVRNCLTRFWAFVYKRQVSNFGTAPFQQSARTSLERLVTSDTRLEPGRATKRLAMKANANQGRSLKIESSGDFFYRKITPKIRLAGQWLEEAGFKPGHRVEVCFEQPGTLTLRFVEQSQEAAL